MWYEAILFKELDESVNWTDGNVETIMWIAVSQTTSHFHVTGVRCELLESRTTALVGTVAAGAPWIKTRTFEPDQLAGPANLLYICTHYHGSCYIISELY